MTAKKPAKDQVVELAKWGGLPEYFRLTGRRRPCNVPGQPYEVELDVGEAQSQLRWVVVGALRGMEGLDLQFEDVPAAEAA